MRVLGRWPAAAASKSGSSGVREISENERAAGVLTAAARCDSTPREMEGKESSEAAAQALSQAPCNLAFSTAICYRRRTPRRRKGKKPATGNMETTLKPTPGDQHMGEKRNGRLG